MDDPTISWGFVPCEVVWGAHEWVLVHDHLSSNRGIVVSDKHSHCMVPQMHSEHLT